MSISCSAQSHWGCSSERLTEHAGIIDTVKTNVGAANEKGAMHLFQSYPTVFLRSRHLRAGRRRMRKQAAPVILVFIVRRRGIIRQLVHVLDEDDARDALAAGEAVCGHVE